jgi:adenylate cyclase
LGVFPLAEGDLRHQRACDDALSAAADAEERMSSYNARRAEDGLPPLDYGIGLHVGRLTYGNIGIPERLEFTVIGRAANKAARIESLTKEVEHRVLASAEFAELCPERLRPIGTHELRGVPGEHMIFIPQAHLGY